MKTIALNVSALLLIGTLLSSCVGYVPASTSVGVTVGPRPYGYYGYSPYARPYYRRAPVIVRPRYHYRAPNPRYYGGGRGRGYYRGGRHW